MFPFRPASRSSVADRHHATRRLAGYVARRARPQQCGHVKGIATSLSPAVRSPHLNLCGHLLPNAEARLVPHLRQQVPETKTAPAGQAGAVIATALRRPAP